MMDTYQKEDCDDVPKMLRAILSNQKQLLQKIIQLNQKVDRMEKNRAVFEKSFVATVLSESQKSTSLATPVAPTAEPKKLTLFKPIDRAEALQILEQRLNNKQFFDQMVRDSIPPQSHRDFHNLNYLMF